MVQNVSVNHDAAPTVPREFDIRMGQRKSSGCPTERRKGKGGGTTCPPLCMYIRTGKRERERERERDKKSEASLFVCERE